MVAATAFGRPLTVGTTGRGSTKAVYALDITNPASPAFLWEHSAADTGYSAIGQITGQPVIAQTADGTWSVLAGNGYNNSGHSAALLQFDVVSGSLSVHPTGVPGSNGLSAPAVWMANPVNGLSTTAYAGDALGNVWSFALSSSTSSGTLLFTTEDPTGAPQPITGGMLAGQDPTTKAVWLF
ncbi:MAG: PilC/PilY family type IV pilus protein, partial [Streptosporangiaceae bacterium]